MTLGTTLVWLCYGRVYAFMVRPLAAALQRGGGQLNFRHFLTPFMLQLQIALIGGLIVALPFICWEVWAFVAPGLTRSERRAVRPLVPVATLLFAMGVATAYLLTGPCVRWMMSYRPPGTHMLLDLNENLLLIVKFYLAFGLGFQLPILLVLLTALGIVDSRFLTSHWREATVAIFIIAAIITPTWDPLTMTAAALPLVILYLLTLGVIRVLDKRRAKAARNQPSEGMGEEAR